MQRTWILGVALLVAGASVSACGGDDDDSAADGGTSYAGAAAAGRGGASGAAGRAGATAGAAAAGRGGSTGTTAGATAAGRGGSTGTTAGTSAAGAGAAGATASGEDAGTAEQDIIETAVAAGSFKQLAAALTKAGLVDALKGAGPFTVFAPSDDAFDAFEKANPGVLAGLSVGDLTNILKYHVISGAAVKSTDLKNGELAKTLLGPVVAIDTSAGVKINDANVTKADVVASNGVIHVIDKILLAPKDIIDTATAAGNFTKLAAALTSANLVAALKGPGPFTVFAPTDEAFAKLSAVPTGEALANILQYHVVSGIAGPLDLKDKGVVTTLSGSPALVELTGGAKIAGANITKTNIVASNGVIHIIDTVIVPPANDIIQTATAAGNFTQLAQALTTAGLVDDLKAKGPFTVFAPTDAAFGALTSAPTGDALKNVLLYHVVMGAVGAGDLKAGPVPTLLTDKNLTIDLASGVKVNDANVTMANIITKNGVIHVVDKVLVPN